MAELILSEEEKEALSYLDWDDETLGRLVKYLAASLVKSAKDQAPEMGNIPCNIATAVTVLVSHVNELGKDAGQIEVDGLTRNGGKVALGNWRITVERTNLH
jgi:hypothetical protein